MAEKYGPYAAGAGFALGQDDFLDHLGPMLQGDGVDSVNFIGPALQVRGNSSGMQVLVAPGQAMIRGDFYYNDSDRIVTLEAADGAARVDRIVLRLDRNHAGGGQTYPVALRGTAGSNVPPALTRDIGGVWEIPLAQVAVGALVSGINPENVTDERLFLPLKTPVIDSRTPTLYNTLQTASLVVFDKNPAVNGLVQKVGGVWRPVRPADTGWQVVGNQPEWIGMGGAATLLAYRVIGNTCYWRGDIAHDYGTNPDIQVVPLSLMPSWLYPGTGPDGGIHFAQAVTAYSYAGGPPEGGWSLLFINEAPTAMRIRAIGPNPIVGQRLTFCFSYPLD
jgi:hypothetical protein